MVEETAQTIFEALKGRTFGAVTVIDAQVVATADEDNDPTLSLGLVLNDPSGDTWPKDDVRTLRREVTTMAFEANLALPLSVMMQPESDAPQADDDAFAI